MVLAALRALRLIVPVAAMKLIASPESVIVRLAFVVALPKPESVSVPSTNADPPLLRFTVWDDGVAVFVSAVVVFSKNWMVEALLLAGLPPSQVPWVLGPPVNQSRGDAGVPTTFELAHVEVDWASALPPSMSAAMNVAGKKRVRSFISLPPRLPNCHQQFLEILPPTVRIRYLTCQPISYQNRPNPAFCAVRSRESRKGPGAILSRSVEQRPHASSRGSAWCSCVYYRHASQGYPMTTLPNAHIAEVPENKILGYLLNTAHPDGAGKAAFFSRWNFRGPTGACSSVLWQGLRKPASCELSL